jgi:hypothetical protein
MIGGLSSVIFRPISAENISLINDYIQQIDGFFGYEEGRANYNIARETRMPKGAIVEIGSYKGRSSMCLGLGAKEIGDVVWTIDDHGASFAEEQKQSRRSAHDLFDNILKWNMEGVVLPIIAKSEVVARYWSYPIRFLFIDGDHSTESVIKDWVNWSKFVVEGGIVVFHDEPIETVRLGMEQSVRKSEFMEWASLEDRRWVAFVRPGKVWWQALAKPAF